MNEETSLCFLCTSSTKSSSNSKNISSLSNNLDVIFFLKNLLQVPKDYLVNQLKASGDSPDNWISLCEQCTQLTEKARKLHQNILTIEKELKSIQGDILGKIRKPHLFSLNINNQEEDRCNDKENSNFLGKIKHFVKNYNYPNLDEIPDHQFLEGDQLARNLQSQSRISTELLLFDGSNTQEEIKVEVDLETFSSPSSPISASPKDASLTVAKPAKVRKKRNKTDHLNFGCEICGNRMSSYFSLYRHRRFVHKIGKGTNVTPRPSQRSLSTLESDWDGNLVCKFCGKEFCDRMRILKHIKFVHRREFDVTCHLCGIGVISEHHLKLHLMGKHRDDPVAKHLEEEEGIKHLKCPMVGCPSRFIRKKALDKHVEKFHGGSGKGLEEIDTRFKCQFCGKGFWNNTKLRHHEEIHEGEGKEDWKCEICGKGFSTKQYLRYHQLNTHKQAKRFQQK